MYAHYVFGGKERRRVRFGTAAAPCGTLRSDRMRALPVTRPAVGTWTIQIDTRRSYRARTTGVIRIRVSVYRTYRARAASASAGWSLAAER